MIPPSNAPTVGLHMAEFLKHIHKTRAAHTARTYAGAMRKFVEFLIDNHVSIGDVPGKLTMKHFIGFPGWLAAHTASRRSALVYNAAAKALLDFLLVQGHLAPS